MSNHDQPRQRELPFDQLYADAKEQQRLDRVEQLLGSIPKITRASAPQFDYDKATAIARAGK